MADVNPSPAGDTGVVAGAAGKENVTLTVLKWTWVILGAILVLVTSIVALGFADRLSLWLSAMPYLSGIVVAMGAAAFGGPAIKRAQEAKAEGK